MIVFEIYSSITQIPPRRVTLYFEEFLIGMDAQCDLRLPASTGISTRLKGKQTEAGLIIKGNIEDTFWVDGKKIKGSKLILPKQIIKLGETTFSLKENHTDQINHTLDIGKQYERFSQEKSEYMPILEAIEKEILYANDIPISPKEDLDENL